MNKSLLIDFISLAAIWGSSFLFMRLGAAEFGVFATAGLRVLIAAAFLAPILWFSGHWQDLQRRAGSILFVGLFNSGIPFALYAYAVLSISTGLSAILNATVPLFGAVVAWVWLKDRPDAWRILGLIIGFLGVVLLAGENANFKPGGTGWAILACLMATVCYALSASYTKRYLTGVQPLALATGSQIGASLGLALPMFWFWPAQMPSLTPWLSLMVLGVVCTGVAYILYFRLIQRAGPARALAVTFVVPVFALIYGGLFLGEQLTLWMLLCGAIIVLGTALSTGFLKLGQSARP